MAVSEGSLLWQDEEQWRRVPGHRSQVSPSFRLWPRVLPRWSEDHSPDTEPQQQVWIPGAQTGNPAHTCLLQHPRAQERLPLLECSLLLHHDLAGCGSVSRSLPHCHTRHHLHQTLGTQDLGNSHHIHCVFSWINIWTAHGDRGELRRLHFIFYLHSSENICPQDCRSQVIRIYIVPHSSDKMSDESLQCVEMHNMRFYHVNPG